MTLRELMILAFNGASMMAEWWPEEKERYVHESNEILDMADLWDDLMNERLEDIRLYKIDTSPEHLDIDIEDIPDAEEF